MAGAVVVIAGVTGSGGAAQCSKIAGPPNGSPLVSGRPTTIAGAQAVAGFPVLVPHVQAARLHNLTHAWVDGRRHVALVFAAGKVTITQAPATRLDAVTGFRRFVAQNPAGAAIGRVHGQPALVISPRAATAADPIRPGSNSSTTESTSTSTAPATEQAFCWRLPPAWLPRQRPAW